MKLWSQLTVHGRRSREDEHSEYLDLPKTVSGALIGAQGAVKVAASFLFFLASNPAATGSRIRQFQDTSGVRMPRADETNGRDDVFRTLSASEARIDIDKSGARCKVRLTGSQARSTKGREFLVIFWGKNIALLKCFCLVCVVFSLHVVSFLIFDLLCWTVGP